jgi:hypothetical protein
MLGCQSGYILQVLRALGEHRTRAVDVRDEVMASFNQTPQEAMQGTAWAGNWTSWYKMANGQITNNWSGSVEGHKRRTALSDPSEHEMAREAAVTEAS